MEEATKQTSAEYLEHERRFREATEAERGEFLAGAQREARRLYPDDRTGQLKHVVELLAVRLDEVARPVAYDELSGVVHEAVGAASMCWHDRPTGVFDADRARQVAEHLVAAVRRVAWPQGAALPNAEALADALVVAMPLDDASDRSAMDDLVSKSAARKAVLAALAGLCPLNDWYRDAIAKTALLAGRHPGGMLEGERRAYDDLVEHLARRVFPDGAPGTSLAYLRAAAMAESFDQRHLAYAIRAGVAEPNEQSAAEVLHQLGLERKGDELWLHVRSPLDGSRGSFNLGPPGGIAKGALCGWFQTKQMALHGDELAPRPRYEPAVEEGSDAS